MITLHEEILVPRSVEECFRYVADFRTTAEWDATAFAATKITAGPVQLGSQFVVDCLAGPSRLRLNYEIIEYNPWHSVVLKGRGRLFEVTDTIVFSEREGKTHIDYTAVFTYRYGLEKFAHRFESSMRAMGAASLAGLERALLDKNRVLEIDPKTERADALVVPGVALFSKLGYKRGLKRWQPVSRSLAGNHVVLTGASSGLGLASAIALAEAQANLTLVIRDPKKVAPLQATLKQETGRTDIRIELADLSLMSEVDRLTELLCAEGKPIDVLINNAGALFNDYGTTSEGYEQSFALLLLSPWRLTRGLLPCLRGHDDPARVINVVSGGMYTETLRCKGLEMKPERYQGDRAYARCKRALTVLTEQWAADWADDNIIVNAMHPGWADTPGVKSALPRFRALTRRILRTSEEGADTIIWLARAREAGLVTGKLFLDREIRRTHLLAKTQESVTERHHLPEFLEQQHRHEQHPS